MESTTIGGRRWGNACPRHLFFVPGISRQSILFCLFSVSSFEKSKDCISTRLPHPSRNFSAICGYPAGRAAEDDGHAPRARPIARHGSSKLGSLRSAAEWSAPSTARDLETHGVGQAGAFGDRQTTKGGPSIQKPIWRSLKRLRGRSPSFGAKGTRSSWTWTTCSPSGAPPGTRGGTR